MPDVVSALLRREEIERDGDERQHVIKRSWSRGPEERFQFGERLFDRIEVPTVGRQTSGPRADRFDGRADVGTRTCSTYGRKLTASMGPSKTAGALTRSTRKAAITVWVSQWLQGVWS